LSKFTSVRIFELVQ